MPEPDMTRPYPRAGWGRYFPPLSSGRAFDRGILFVLFFYYHCFIGLVGGEIYAINRNIIGLYIFSRVGLSKENATHVAARVSPTHHNGLAVLCN